MERIAPLLMAYFSHTHIVQDTKVRNFCNKMLNNVVYITKSFYLCNAYHLGGGGQDPADMV